MVTASTYGIMKIRPGDLSSFSAIRNHGNILFMIIKMETYNLKASRMDGMASRMYAICLFS